MSNSATPVPYQPGKSLQLQVLRNCCNLPLSQSVTATISEAFDITLFSVMDVTINTESGSNVRAVLKLYDRRFGQHVRNIRNEYEPHTAEKEAAFQSFVRRGEMDPFLRELEEMKKAESFCTIAWHLHDGTLEGIAKYEAAMWNDFNKFFDCETKAYAWLSDLQGRSIPRMYAHVCLVLPSSDVPPDLLQPQTARYFEVKGILLEFISGYSLCDLATSTLAPPDPEKTWPALVQSTVDVVHDINRRGVIMKACGAYNVVVDKHSQTPFIISLAECRFKDESFKIWENISEDDENWNPDPDAWYWERVREEDNTGAIGAVMASKLLRDRGMKLKVKYPVLIQLLNEGLLLL